MIVLDTRMFGREIVLEREVRHPRRPFFDGLVEPRDFHLWAGGFHLVVSDDRSPRHGGVADVAR
jgi:hypothetical protein